MSDVVVAASLLTGLWCLVRRPHPFIVGAGVACGVAVLVRPNLAPTVLVLAVWVAARPWFNADVDWSATLRQAVLFLAMAGPGFLVPAWAYWRFFGSPFESGYGTLSQLYDARRIPANLAAYVGYIFDTRAPLALVGLGALALPAARLWPGTTRWRLVAVWLLIVSVVMQYLTYEYAGNAAYLRFLLPCLPLALIGLGHLLWFATRPGWPTALVVAAIVVAGAGPVYAMARDGGFDLRIERRYAGAAAMAAAHTEPNALMLSMQHSGSVRYYGPRMSLRYDWLDPAWLDRSVAWLVARGHPVYALLDASEVAAVRRRFAGQARASGFDAPIAVFRGRGAVYLFDLTRPLVEHPAAVTVDDSFAPRGCVPPAPQAPFDL
jgi:hypothetical protein